MGLDGKGVWGNNNLLVVGDVITKIEIYMI